MPSFLPKQHACCQEVQVFLGDFANELPGNKVQISHVNVVFAVVQNHRSDLAHDNHPAFCSITSCLDGVPCQSASTAAGMNMSTPSLKALLLVEEYN
eukprot:4420174-Amphidinium_carterae.1